MKRGTAPRSNWLKVEEGLLTFCLNKYKGLLSTVYDGIANGKARTNLLNATRALPSPFLHLGSGNVRKLIARVSLNKFQNVSEYVRASCNIFILFELSLRCRRKV